MSVIVRCAAESQTAVNGNGRRTGLITDHGDLTVKIRNRWTEKLLTKMHFHRRQGYLPDLVTKKLVPTTFESSVVK